MASPPKSSALNGVVEMVDVIDQKHQTAHDRLRTELTELEGKVESNYAYLRDRAEVNKGRIDTLALTIDNVGSRPVNIDKIIFTPKIAVAIVVSLLSIYGFFLASTNSLRGDIHDLKVSLDSKQLTDKARADLQDVQFQSIRTDVTDMKRQIQLQQYEIQNLKELVSKTRK